MQKTAYELRISDWSSDVCSSDLGPKVGDELKVDGALATLLAMLGIAIYVWFRFEWQFGVAALISLLHDVVATIGFRSEEHTSELQSLMRISSAVFCLKKKKQ